MWTLFVNRIKTVKNSDFIKKIIPLESQYAKKAADWPWLLVIDFDYLGLTQTLFMAEQIDE